MDSNPFGNTETFLGLLSSQLEHESCPTPVQHNVCEETSQAVLVKTERRKWTPKEDLVLISAWLNTSKDPVVSNEQKAGAFWKRIAAYFNASPLLVREPERPSSHCKQRWGRINDLVCKFVGCYETAMKGQASGQNEDDVMKAAHDIFYNDHKIKFTLDHAWRELRHDQKWCANFSGKDSFRAKRRKVQAGSAHSSTSVQDSPEDDVSTGRPPGIKAAKKMQSGSKKSVDEMVEFQKIWDIKQQDLALKEKLSRTKVLENLLAKSEPLSELEMALKNKLMEELLN